MDHYQMKTNHQKNVLVLYGTPHLTTGTGLSNGFYHNNKGPALQYPDGTKIYCEHGNFHRLDGPAIDCNNCSLRNNRYFIHGEEMDRVSFEWLRFLQEIIV